MTFASVKNSTGAFVRASTDSVSSAAHTAQIPEDYRISITNAPGKDSCSISVTFTYLLVYEDAPDAQKGQALAGFNVVGDPRRPKIRGTPELRAASSCAREESGK